MLYQYGSEPKQALPVQAGMFGFGHGIYSVTRDRSSKPRSESGRTPKHAVPANGQDGALPDPDWNKDIRAYYDAVVEEPVPQEFVDLLQQIAKDIKE